MNISQVGQEFSAVLLRGHVFEWAVHSWNVLEYRKNKGKKIRNIDCKYFVPRSKHKRIKIMLILKDNTKCAHIFRVNSFLEKARHIFMVTIFFFCCFLFIQSYAINLHYSIKYCHESTVCLTVLLANCRHFQWIWKSLTGSWMCDASNPVPYHKENE